MPSVKMPKAWGFDWQNQTRNTAYPLVSPLPRILWPLYYMLQIRTHTHTSENRCPFCKQLFCLKMAPPWLPVPVPKWRSLPVVHSIHRKRVRASSPSSSSEKKRWGSSPCPGGCWFTGQVMLWKLGYFQMLQIRHSESPDPVTRLGPWTLSIGNSPYYR